MLTSLGVGIVANSSITGLLLDGEIAPDYVEIIPDQAWTDRGCGAEPRFVERPDDVAMFTRLSTQYPLVAHGVGLSIASAIDLDTEYLRQLAAWRERFGFVWISEHLAAVRVSGTGAVNIHAGVALPLPWDYELLTTLVARLSAAEEILATPLLLENGVVYTPVPDTDMSETEFVNRMTTESGCGLLLDLHNLYVNSVNLDVDTYAFLNQLDLDAVHEVHIAGGNVFAGAYLDSHAGPCPEEVWQLLDHVIPRCANLRGVTFEFHESYFPRLGCHGVTEQLARASEAWKKRPVAR